MSGDAASATITVTTTAAASGDYTMTATVGQLIPETNTANNTLVVKATQPAAPTPPPPPPPAVRPVIGSPVPAPHTPAAGKRFTVTFPISRSSDGRPLTGGTAVFAVTVAGSTLAHTQSFVSGKAKLSLVVPKRASGKLLKVKLTVKTSGGTVTRLASFHTH
jgi:hypothetical protein